MGNDREGLYSPEKIWLLFHFCNFSDFGLQRFVCSRIGNGLETLCSKAVDELRLVADDVSCIHFTDHYFRADKYYPAIDHVINFT